jgi:hypothetical protein
LYELEPAPGTKTSRVIGLADDIARSMSAVSVRVAVIPGRNVIGIELPNISRETVYLRELLSDADSNNAGALALFLGKDIGGTPVNADLSRMPHLLIAGTTGSGKSVAINTMILSILYRLAPHQGRRHQGRRRRTLRRSGRSLDRCLNRSAFRSRVCLGRWSSGFGCFHRSGVRLRSGCGNVLALACQNRDRSADLHAVRALGNQDLRDLALVDRFELHRRFVGLDLGENVSGLYLVTLFHEPFGERAFFHCWRKGGHFEFGRHERLSAWTGSRAQSQCGGRGQVGDGRLRCRLR